MPRYNSQPFNQLKKEDRKFITDTIETIVDVNTPLETSKLLLKNLEEKLNLLGVFENSNILIIEDKTLKPFEFLEKLTKLCKLKKT